MALPNSFDEMHEYLETAYRRFAQQLFVNSDPIQIPHRFADKADVEIAALLASTIAWGNRRSIISSMERLLNLMGNRPHEFVLNFGRADAQRLKGFVHRTFNADDAAGFIQALQRIYLNHNGLHGVFLEGYQQSGSIEGALRHFRHIFCAADFPQRSLKHVANVDAGSAAKRLNMFLRWMVRPSTEGIDFGLWNDIPTSALLVPLDVHSARVGRTLELLQRRQNDLRAVQELTHELSLFDPNDPVKYDFALFGLGVYGEL